MKCFVPLMTLGYNRVNLDQSSRATVNLRGGFSFINGCILYFSFFVANREKHNTILIHLLACTSLKQGEKWELVSGVIGEL